MLMRRRTGLSLQLVQHLLFHPDPIIPNANGVAHRGRGYHTQFTDGTSIASRSHHAKHWRQMEWVPIRGWEGKGITLNLQLVQHHLVHPWTADLLLPACLDQCAVTICSALLFYGPIIPPRAHRGTTKHCIDWCICGLVSSLAVPISSPGVDRSTMDGYVPTVHRCSFMCTTHIDRTAHTPALTSWGTLETSWIFMPHSGRGTKHGMGRLQSPSNT